MTRQKNKIVGRPKKQSLQGMFKTETNFFPTKQSSDQNNLAKLTDSSLPTTDSYNGKWESVFSSNCQKKKKYNW